MKQHVIKRKKEQALAQKMEEFTACYEDMNNIFVDQEKRLTDKKHEKTHSFLSKLTRKTAKKRYKKNMSK